ncbi:autotransporter assembly complex protein TamA [Maritalea porphyrae]|uniref:autotransporter assembly complex protein TamA n=1 Tax=Maritalea porphyrae TaxID=880732 RepID=UPI0022AFC9C2|nr:autotransporter assembly complex family protein [Maritalea porphyrae]MCZ4271236.1 autotransporter assembly complex protein TamA [Maritalea porphyrae]
MHIYGSKLVSISFLVAISFCATAPARAFDLFGLFKKQEAVTASNAADVVNPVNYSASIQSGNAVLDELLTPNSVLIKEQTTPASGTTGLVTRARIDQKRLLGALYSEAYYGGTVDIEVNGQNIDNISLDTDLSGKFVNVAIKVSAGPSFTFGRPFAQSNAGAIDLAEFGIVEGATAKSSLILSAEAKLIKKWKSEGYPFVRIIDRTIEADHTTNKLDVSIQLETGNKAAFGAITVVGNTDVNASFIAEQADILVGQLYSPNLVSRATRRLQEVGVFDSVVVSTAEQPSADGSVEVNIEVSERKPRTIGIGLTAGNFEGFGVEGFWKHRNLFGNAESLRAEASIGRIGQGGISDLDAHTGLVFVKPNAIGPATSFEAKTSFDIINSNAFSKQSGKLEVSLSNDLRDDLTVKGGIATEYAVVDNGITTTNTSFLYAPFALTYDTRDSTLDPTNGWYASLLAEPTFAYPSHATFVKTSFNASTYYTVDPDNRLVLAGRVGAGTIFGTDISNVPTDRRFFSGGSGSIRGYGFQMAGPLTAGGKPQGGLSFMEASVEARYKVTDDIGVVAFVDTGGAFTSNMPGQGGSIYTGYGLGVRYLTPIGPIRADIAFPLNKIPGQPQYGLYLGIGQAF